MRNVILRSMVCLSSALMLCVQVGVSAPAAKEQVVLTPEGTQALAEYEAMLASLRSQLKPRIPAIDAEKVSAFMAIRKQAEEPGIHNRVLEKHVKEAAVVASNIWTDVDAFLASSTLDDQLVTCAVLADATPRGLAEFAQQGAVEKNLIDGMLANPAFMKELLVAGGAKADRYWKTMELLRTIISQNKRATKGVFKRLAIAVALELAAPELCGYQDIDPVKRYQYYESAYLNKDLDGHFDEHSIWLLRQVINDPHSEDDMLWMREMLWNYRPDHINVEDDYNGRYVGLMYSEFGHKRIEYDESLPQTRMQQIIDKGGQCGPKAFFGRCLGRTFGVPVWGCRLRSHTAMTYWTPKGWETILGVSFKNGFWTVDQVEPMRGWLFRAKAVLRDHSEEHTKVCRAEWIGSVLGEEKVDGMNSGTTGGLWNSLALHRTMDVYEANKRPEPPKVEKGKEIKGYPERLGTPPVKDELKQIVKGPDGRIIVPAVACVSPTYNTKKVVFMNNRDGGMDLHYKRWELPEPLVYEIDVPAAGSYDLTAEAVTVNRDQFFVLSVNDASEPVEVKMPYTVGKWGQSDPVRVTLSKGKNRLVINRSIEDGVDFEKEAWKYAGPYYGGVTLRSFALSPVD